MTAQSKAQTQLFAPLPEDRFGDDPVVFALGRANELSPQLADALRGFAAEFDNLPGDQWLRTEHIFRQRRFGLFRVDTVQHSIERLAHRPFHQTIEINPQAGGIQREFEPITDQTANNLFLHQLIWDVLAVLPEERLRSIQHWEVGVHLIRVVASPEQPGYPAPYGMHRDGHAFTSISLIDRTGVKGGRSLFADLEGAVYRELELEASLDTVVFEDTRCMHDVTPVTVLEGIPRAARDVCGFSLNPCP